ncbi:MAG: hypothetical protein ACREIA_01810 [Opitutaceae bacterium]
MKPSAATRSATSYAVNVLRDAVTLMHRPDPTLEQLTAAWRSMQSARDKLASAMNLFSAECGEAVHEANRYEAEAIVHAFAHVESPAERAAQRLPARLRPRPLMPDFRPTHTFSPAARRLVSVSGTVS